MGILSNIVRGGSKVKADDVPIAAALEHTIQPVGDESSSGDERKRPREKSGRTEVYAVRVRETFKGEILTLQAELQLERQKLYRKAKKVTEGEIIELMLETFKNVRSDADTSVDAVLLSNDVRQGVHKIARHLQCSPAEVVERLVVRMVGELELVPRK